MSEKGGGAVSSNDVISDVDVAGEAEVPADPRDPDTTAEVSGGTGDGSRRVSLSLRSLVVAVVLVAALVASGVMTWLYFGERAQVVAQQQQAQNFERAEQIAMDYAVEAAAMNFQDLAGWKAKLVAGTAPGLSDRLGKAADEMEQLLVPLEWNSTSQPLIAKVRSETNGVYVVDTFVSVLTKTKQAPDALQSTATYSITIDSNDNWQITDVGGIGAMVEPK